MATWGPAPFENDDATAFLSEVVEDGPPALQEAFEVVTDTDEYLEATEAARAVAAAELLAAHLTGDHSQVEAPELLGWLRELREGELAHLSESAVDALERVEDEDSELAERWDGSDDGAAWHATLDRLRAALA